MQHNFSPTRSVTFYHQVPAWVHICCPRAVEVCPHSQQELMSVLPLVYGQLIQVLHAVLMKNHWPRHLSKNWVNSSVDGWQSQLSLVWTTGDTRMSMQLVVVAERHSAKHLIMQCSYVAFVYNMYNICRYIHHNLIAGAGGHMRGGIPQARGWYVRMHTAL